MTYLNILLLRQIFTSPQKRKSSNPESELLLLMLSLRNHPTRTQIRVETLQLLPHMKSKVENPMMKLRRLQ